MNIFLTFFYNMSNYGYIYCISNVSMPGIVKIGMTARSPIERLMEANRSNTWGPPTPYVLDFAKKVIDPRHKESQIHNLLTQYGRRVNPDREFFYSTQNEIRALFDLIEGEMWESNGEVLMIGKMHNSMKCFHEGQRIRHVIAGPQGNHIWICSFDRERNMFLRDNILYSSLTGFIQKHYAELGLHKASLNGWRECECEIEYDKWVTTYSM